jgi:hypothetical protein
MNNLIANITGKAKHYKDDIVLANLFLMNNLNYAYNAIQGSPLAAFIPAAAMNDIEERTGKAQDVYLKSTWETAVGKLGPVPKDRNEFAGPKSKRMNKKQRMAIKHQFRDFGQRVDEIISKHQGYNLRNSKLMASVYAEAIKVIMQTYEAFWISWKDTGFSKTPEKWISYQPPTLAEMITRLYGQDRKRTSDVNTGH